MTAITFDIAGATTKELLAKYNELTGKNATKFSSREAGERQVKTALEARKMLDRTKEMEANGQEAQEQAALAAPVVVEQPVVEAPVEPVVVVSVAKVAAATKKIVQVKKPRIDPMLKLPVDRSAAIARSWTNSAVYDARRQRTGVEVTTKGVVQTFKSTKAAFDALELPLGNCIPFRMKLKALGKLDYVLKSNPEVVHSFKVVATE